MTTLKYAYAGAGVKDDTSVSVQNLLIYYPDDGNNHKYVTLHLGLQLDIGSISYLISEFFHLKL